MSATTQKALLIRLDRIGDLVLTLPVDQHPLLAAASTSWWIPKNLGFVAENANPPRPYREVGETFQWPVFWSLLRELWRERPDVALVFHAPWWVGLVLLLGGVRRRVGPWSQWHSFLFFNRGVRQKRSRGGWHELEYNFQLLEKGLGSHAQSPSPQPLESVNQPPFHRPWLVLDPPDLPVLENFGLAKQTYIVVHPGMGGSARNWATESYIELIQRLSRENKVAITGTPGDKAWIDPIRRALGDNIQIAWLDGRLNGRELLNVLAHARAVVAPSTGVLHLAASTGAPTLGLFSPVKVQAAARWGPKGKRVDWIAPTVECPGHFDCLKEACAQFDCMTSVRVEDVESRLHALMRDL